MTRKFLKDLNIDDAVIDQILDENSRDIGKEKQKTSAAEANVGSLQEALSSKEAELEELKALDADGLQTKLTELQAKYDTDTEELRTQLDARDYSDAINKAIADKGIKFSSKSAEAGYLAALKSAKLELKDGVLTGFDDFHKGQLDSDPGAFQSDKPAPFVKSIGTGGKPADSEPANVTLAKALGKAKAATQKASDDVFSKYT